MSFTRVAVAGVTRRHYRFGGKDPGLDKELENAPTMEALRTSRSGSSLQHLSNLTGVHPFSTPLLETVVLLIVSNIFMTMAWYGHLKYKQQPLVWVILISWSVALFEYIFQVPANRIGAQTFSVMQLKIMQECITLVVFTFIAYLLFGQTLKWNNLVSYLFIIGAVYFSFAY